MKVYKWILCAVLVVVILTAILFFGNFKSEDSALQSNSTVPLTEVQETAVTDYSFSADTFNAQLLTLLNAYRAKSGLSAWTADSALTDGAATRAYECALLESKAHTRPDGTNWFSVLEITENFNYSEVTGISSQKADELLRSWLNSPNIKNGLLSKEYTACGIGCEAVGDTVYTVLILYKP